MAPSSVSNSAAGSSKRADKSTQTECNGVAGNSRKHQKASKSARSGVAGGSKQHATAIKKIARIMRGLKKSNAEELARKITAREKTNDLLRGQRDNWRRFHKTQEQEKAELEAEIKRRREREEELLVKYDAERARNQHIEEQVERLQIDLDDIKAGLRETGKAPVLGDEDRFVLSPVKDFEACRQAKIRFLVHERTRGGPSAGRSLKGRARTY